MSNTEKLLKTLQNSRVRAKFTKKDGSERIMNCTLMASELPEVTNTNPVSAKGYITVWDLDKEDWRSLKEDCTYETIT